MAALPYMQLYVADYLADTAHLTTEEHGAYLLLLFSYWQTGKPLRSDRLASVARLSNERWANVEQTLKEFFHVSKGIWTHFRVEADLAKVDSKTKKNSEAGKLSAKARALAKQALEEAQSTNVATDVEQTYQRNVNHARSGDTDTDTDTKQDQKHCAENKPERAKTINAKSLVAMDVPEQIAKDWLAVRKTKRAPLTQTALEGVKREADKAGKTLAQAIEIAARNSWAGYKASWIEDQGYGQNTGTSTRTLSLVDQVREHNRLAEEARQSQGTGEAAGVFTFDGEIVGTDD